MQKILTTIISDEHSTSEVLKLYLSEFDNLEITQVNQNDKTADNHLYLIDLSYETERKLEVMLNTSSLNPQAKIIALSDNPSVELIIKAMRSGACEFLPIPILKNELTEIINKLTQIQPSDIAQKKCKIITIFSNKGGIGKTSLATNLAVELAKIEKENVALIDLNFQMGDITTFLDLKPSFNISYMLENLDKINETFLLSTLEKYKQSSLYILADPPYFKQADNIQPKQVAKLFNILKETFSYIIVDTDSSFDGKNIAALDNSDMILLVSAANLPALRNTQRCLELFSKLGYDKHKTQLVINRFMENDEIKEAEIEKLLSKNIYWKIPNNYFALMSAINKGVPIGEINNSTNLAQSYKNLAYNISDNIFRYKMVKKFENILNNY